MGRAQQTLLFGLAILAGIVSLMAAAIAWGPKHTCIAQFPKIIGCALATYEGLAGGLVAAGGALFAGWLAWSAARDQIAFERNQAAQAELLSAKLRLEMAEGELLRLERAREVMLKFQVRLKENPAGLAPHASRLAEMARIKEFPFTSRDFDTATLGGQLWDSVNRLRMMAEQIGNQLSGASTEPHRRQVLDENEQNASAVISAFYATIPTIEPAIAKQKAAVDEFRARSEGR